MPDYILLMRDDAESRAEDWLPYLQKLRQRGRFRGGSAIGDGVCLRKQGAAPAITAHLAGYIRVTAEGIEQAKALLAGNPHWEAGGSVEIRELPVSD